VIWISETMLQQTTSTAVIPYFENFIKLFPDVLRLAKAPETQVLKAWAGLGYYSRARNLHKSAKIVAKNSGVFPESHTELIKLPGFGPYTARAVSSLAFSEPVGVLDGNVIRILSRRYDLATEWWKTSERKQLQDLADQAVIQVDSGVMNQAMMELGATICLPKSPKCMICPWTRSCLSRRTESTDQRPLKKPKKTQEIWIWNPIVAKRRGRFALVRNHYAPFLRKQWFLPGHVEKKNTQPKSYDFRHTITHHNIFVNPPDVLDSLPESIKKSLKNTDIKWVTKDEIAEFIPASLVQKVMDRIR